MQRVLVVGSGYSGERIALAHLARGDSVTATAREPARIRRLQDRGATVLKIDLDAAPRDWPAVDRVYYTVPPPAQGEDDARLQRLLDRLPPPATFVYFSSTGVYGNLQGGRADENTPPAPGTARSRRRLAAERQLEAWRKHSESRLIILRVAAIYGPGRLPLERLRRGEPVPRPTDTGPGNRVHAADLVSAAMALGDAGESGHWNINDGNYMSVADFADLVAEQAGLPRPGRVSLDSAQISPGMRSFFSESRRVDNQKLLQLAGFQLQYPHPSEGIRASLREGGLTVTDDDRATAIRSRQ